MKQTRLNDNHKSRYLNGLMLAIVCIMFSFLYLQNTIHKNYSYGKIINKSGKQRMISQRATLLAQSFFLKSNTEVLFEYENLLDTMYADNLAIQRAITDKEIKEYYQVKPDLNSMVLEFLKINNTFIDDPTLENLNQIYLYQNKLLPYLDEAVQLHENFLENNNLDFEDTMIYISIFIIVVLLLEAKFIYIPILDKLVQANFKAQTEKRNFQTILENATDGIHILDKDGNVVMCSPSFAEMLGFDYDEALKLNIKDWNKSINIETQKYLKDKMSNFNIYETTHQRKDGSVIHVQAISKPILIDNKEYYYASTRDITPLIKEQEEKQQALEEAQAAEEEALSIQDELYKTQNDLIDLNLNLENKIDEATKDLNHSLEILNKHIISSKTDLKGNITEASDKFCEISKYSREELIGSNHRLVRHPEESQELFKEIWKTITAKKTWYGRIRNRNKDGETYWVDSTIAPDFDINGNHIGYYSYRVDVTKEIELIQTQEKHNKELEERVNNQLKDIRDKDLMLLEQSKLASMGEMMNNISHQWKQPLNLISINNGSIKYGLQYGLYTTEEIIKYIDEIQDSCEFLSKTISTFSNFLNKNKTFSLYSIENEISSVKNIVETSFKEYNIKLIDDIDYSQSNKAYMVENELAQVVINILNNAKDALKQKESNEESWIKISSLKDTNNYTITIEDNAGGIPEIIIDRIFEPYFTTKFKSQGTGLGLSMSRTIIKDSIKGDISVKNSEYGAKFYLTIPLHKEQNS